MYSVRAGKGNGADRMMSVHLIFVGSFSASYFEQAQREYEKRLSAFAKVVSHPVKESPLPEKPRAGEIENALRREGVQITDILKNVHSCKKIALAIEGEELTSPALAKLLETLPHNGFSSVAFVIGSSHGLAPEVLSGCEKKISLSRMTFPHQLARVMLTEQIYRAFSITAGKTYHK